jgi:hypothetical protein
MTTSEANPAEDVVPSAPPTLVESVSAAPATNSVHTEGSMYACPACREVERHES